MSRTTRRLRREARKTQETRARREPYEERLFAELRRTILGVEADIVGEAKAAVVIDVALMIVALAAASTPLTATPNATFVTCAELAARLETMIAAAKRLAAGSLPGSTLQ
jgi:hypothetical protein